MSRPTGQDTTQASSLSKALQILDVFEPHDRPLSIRQLAERSGVPRSTAHRLAQELVAWGGFERTPQGLRIGVKLFEIGSMAPMHTRLRETVTPLAHNLHEVTKLTVNLAVRDGFDIVYIEKIATRELHVPHSRLGGRAPLHATALGKAILAFEGPSLGEEWVSQPLTRLTPHTIADVGALRNELRRVRKQRVAFDVQESQEGLFCVAAPIIDASGIAIAAISVTGAVALAEAKRYAPAVLMAALAASRVHSPSRI